MQKISFSGLNNITETVTSALVIIKWQANS